MSGVKELPSYRISTVSDGASSFSLKMPDSEQTLKIVFYLRENIVGITKIKVYT